MLMKMFIIRVGITPFTSFRVLARIGGVLKGWEEMVSSL